MTLRFAPEGDGRLLRVHWDKPWGVETGGLVDHYTSVGLRQLDDDTWSIEADAIVKTSSWGASARSWQILGLSGVTDSRLGGRSVIASSTVERTSVRGVHGKSALIDNSTVSDSSVTASAVGSATVHGSSLIDCEVRNSVVNNVSVCNARILDMHVNGSHELLVVYVPHVSGFLTCGPAKGRKGYRFVVGCSVFDSWDELLAGAVEEGLSRSGEMARLKALKPLIDVMEAQLSS